MSEQQKPKKRFSLRKLIYNDKILIIISLLAAVCGLLLHIQRGYPL